jgi:hypothetical protein
MWLARVALLPFRRRCSIFRLDLFLSINTAGRIVPESAAALAPAAPANSRHQTDKRYIHNCPGGTTRVIAANPRLQINIAEQLAPLYELHPVQLLSESSLPLHSG